MAAPEISVVIPLYNEEPNLAILAAEIAQVLDGLDRDYEVLFIDDGSSDGSPEVLRRLSASGVAFDAVPDLCDMAARKDPALRRLAESGPVRIAACYPRAVKWLFHGAGTPLPEKGVEVLNMRDQTAEEVVGALLPPEK